MKSNISKHTYLKKMFLPKDIMLYQITFGFLATFETIGNLFDKYAHNLWTLRQVCSEWRNIINEHMPMMYVVDAARKTEKINSLRKGRLYITPLYKSWPNDFQYFWKKVLTLQNKCVVIGENALVNRVDLVHASLNGESKYICEKLKCFKTMWYCTTRGKSGTIVHLEIYYINML